MKEKKSIEMIIAQISQRLGRLQNYISKGVSIVDPLTTFIADKVRIGKGTVIYPFTVIEENVRIGRGCTIGPYARIRKDVWLKENVEIGNFVEVVRTTIERGSKAKHLTYLGDTFVGEEVNIGAGTIVANYDGKNKHKTRIKKGAFIGSGSILVSPVQIGQYAVTGAGSVVTKKRNVPDNTIVVGVPAKEFKKCDAQAGR